MIGTIINTVAILIGSALGLAVGDRLPSRFKETVVYGMALAVVLIGVQMALKTENILIILGSIILGGIVGEMLGIEKALEHLGQWIETKINRRALAAEVSTALSPTQQDSNSRFVRGFMTASLIFCVGPMAILGAIQDGLTGDFSTLAAKAMLDGFGSIALASSLGIGVGFAAVPVLVYQGVIALAATWIKVLLTDAMIREMTATGGLLIVGLGLNMLEIKRIRVGNLLPALFFAPLIVAIIAVLSQ